MADSTQTAAIPAPARSRKLIWIVVCLVSIVCGAALPVALGAHKLLESPPAEKKPRGEREQQPVVFGEVVVNLADGRMTRYLRLKIVLLVDAEEAKEFTKILEKRKPVLKNWLISHLSGKMLSDVGGTIGVRRVQREIQVRFEELLYSHGEGPAFETLFEEFVVQ